jgi:hypothetical protein
VKTAKTGDLRTKNQQVTRKKMAKIRVFTQALKGPDKSLDRAPRTSYRWVAPYRTNSQRSPVITKVALSDGLELSTVAMSGKAVFISCELAQLGTLAIR